MRSQRCIKSSPAFTWSGHSVAQSYKSIFACVPILMYFASMMLLGVTVNFQLIGLNVFNGINMSETEFTINLQYLIYTISLTGKY